MSVEPVPFEKWRYFVTSRSRPGQQHTVDLQYVEDGHTKPHCACGCESNFIYGRPCPHIEAAVKYAQQHL